MRITTLKKLPPVNDLLTKLKQQFSQQYSCRLFGIGSQKTIIVSESSFVGAQISIRENEVTIEPVPPSVFGGLLILLMSTELALILGPIFLYKDGSWSARREKLQKTLGVYFRSRYEGAV